MSRRWHARSGRRWARGVYADIGRSTFFLGAAESYAPVIARSELMAPEQVDAWLTGLRRASEDGVFFAACNYYAYIATIEP